MTLGRCPLSILCSRGTPPTSHTLSACNQAHLTLYLQFVGWGLSTTRWSTEFFVPALAEQVPTATDAPPREVHQQPSVPAFSCRGLDNRIRVYDFGYRGWVVDFIHKGAVGTCFRVWVSAAERGGNNLEGLKDFHKNGSSHVRILA